MTRTLELLDLLWPMALLWALTVTLIAVAVVAGDVADWLAARRRARRDQYVDDLEAELADVLDELVDARRRNTVLEARCARLAVDAVWPRGEQL